MTEDVLLGSDVLRHVPVYIQMVWGQIGHHGDMGAAIHGHQLEAGQLQHRIIVGLHALGVAQQRVADVAAQPHGVPRGLQQLGDDGGSGGLAVGAGDGDDGARAYLEECLHLAGEHAAVGHGRRDLRHIGPQTRRAEDHVLVQALQIIRAKPQRTAGALQLVGQRAQLLPGPLVAGGDTDAVIQQQTHQRRVADADAQHCHRFIS